MLSFEKNYNLTFTFQMEGTCILELFVVSNALWSDKMKKNLVTIRLVVKAFVISYFEQFTENLRLLQEQ